MKYRILLIGFNNFLKPKEKINKKSEVFQDFLTLYQDLGGIILVPFEPDSDEVIEARKDFSFLELPTLYDYNIIVIYSHNFNQNVLKFKKDEFEIFFSMGLNYIKFPPTISLT